MTRTKKSGGVPEVASNTGRKGVKKRRDSDVSTLEDASEEEEKEEEYLVNPNLHLNSDVPENVQDFIRSISRTGLTDQNETSSKKMLEEKKRKGRRPCRRGSVAKEEIERKPSVEVIITGEYEPEKLSNREYDRLKKVLELKLIQSICEYLCFQDTRFTEYEIVQLWSTFQRDFPTGKINRVQITQLIKNVFPK